MITLNIRPIAICLFSNGNRILINEEFDTVQQDRFCRPLGGGIEFSESSRQAMLREIREELGFEIENLCLITVIENIFTYEGSPRHEIVFVYDAEFVDKSLYGLKELTGYEHDLNIQFKAEWLSLDEMQKRQVRLVPEGLSQLIAK